MYVINTLNTSNIMRSEHNIRFYIMIIGRGHVSIKQLMLNRINNKLTSCFEVRSFKLFVINIMI